MGKRPRILVCQTGLVGTNRKQTKLTSKGKEDRDGRVQDLLDTALKTVAIGIYVDNGYSEKTATYTYTSPSKWDLLGEKSRGKPRKGLLQKSRAFISSLRLPRQQDDAHCGDLAGHKDISQLLPLWISIPL